MMLGGVHDIMIVIRRKELSHFEFKFWMQQFTNTVADCFRVYIIYFLHLAILCYVALT